MKPIAAINDESNPGLENAGRAQPAQNSATRRANLTCSSSRPVPARTAVSLVDSAFYCIWRTVGAGTDNRRHLVAITRAGLEKRTEARRRWCEPCGRWVASAM